MPSHHFSLLCCRRHEVVVLAGYRRRTPAKVPMETATARITPALDLIQYADVKRLGTIMTPEQGSAREAEGVLNPAAVRHHDGQLYLFPRLVAAGNFSRIGVAAALFSAEGDVVGVERLGLALEPQVSYEQGDDGRGGCEDPRISFCKPFDCYIMSYVAFGRSGPRAALAASADLQDWRRLGLVGFEAQDGIDFADCDNKDLCVFPHLVADDAGRPSVAVLHRPHFNDANGETPAGIWISYAPLADGGTESIGSFSGHRRVAGPEQAWECLKIGCGTPPVLTPLGWLVVYHGVGGRDEDGCRVYSAGIMLLDADDPSIVLYRSPDPILWPELPEERSGVCAEVVFPTGIDPRPDLGELVFDIYYGMADSRIGAARLTLIA